MNVARWRPSQLKQRFNAALNHVSNTISEEIGRLRSTLESHHAEATHSAQLRHEHAVRMQAESLQLHESSERNADARVEAVVAQILALDAQSSGQAADRFTAIAAHLKAIGDVDALIMQTLGDIAMRVEALHRRLEATQGLVGRVYDGSLGWDRQLKELRSDPEYDKAYAEAEPLVSVRLCTWNRGELLVERALASLQRQTYERWEAIVIGDACTDDTAERIAALGDPRIHFENLDVRGPYPDVPEQLWQVAGIRGAQRAFQLATGRWVAQLDDDDEWSDDHLEVLLAEAVRSRAEVVYGKWRMVEATSGQRIGSFGSWPVEKAHITFQCAIEHGHLRRFLPDLNAYLADEPGDWHRARRLLDAGVRFAFLDREVATVYYAAKTPAQQEFLDTMLPDQAAS